MKNFKAAVLCMVIAIPFLPVSVVVAQKAKETFSAPIPAQILTAKKVFVSNAGGDEWMDDETHFNGGPERTYNQFYAAMKNWGRYELVASPADAELLIEIQFSVLSSFSRPILDPQFRLVLRDPKTNAALWGFTEHVQWAVLLGNRDKNFDKALGQVVSEVQRIAAQPEGTAEDEKKN